MAAELVTLPFLTPWRGSRTLGAGAAAPDARHIGAICRVIAMSPLSVDRFTAADVFDVLEQISRTSDLRVVDAAQIRSPLGYLATLLRRVAAYTAAYNWPSRTERATQADVERERARTRRQAELDAERIRLEQLHSPEAQAQVNAVLKQMRRDFPRPSHRRTTRSS